MNRTTVLCPAPAGLPRGGSRARYQRIGCLVFLLSVGLGQSVAQPYGEPDRSAPGDAIVQQYLAAAAEALHETFPTDYQSLETWENQKPRYQSEYLYMLGLSPLPSKTPLQATITGSLTGDGFVVENLHYQSQPHLYVTANLYRPSDAQPGERLPAVVYVCGHAHRGRNGNKTAYQSHGIWFARHGYLCLMLDTLQLGEIAAIHHGTYREERWWWHSRGYTPAGVECWNGIRAIDYLVGRSDVDPERIAVTGISGGGAATFWIAAADDRAKVAVPVSGMADLPSYLGNRVINGHCDCMFLYNTFQWPWTRVAALIAPRPLLFINSHQDSIFPMDANQRVIARLERIYALYGAGDRVDSLVSLGGHAYREDIRQASFRFINLHLKGDPSDVTDSEVDLVINNGNTPQHPIDPERLRVFPNDADLPADQLNDVIDQYFVPKAEVRIPARDEFQTWKNALMTNLRRVCFAWFPEDPAVPAVKTTDVQSHLLETEAHVEVLLRRTAVPSETVERIVLRVMGDGEPPDQGATWQRLTTPNDLTYELEPRGVGDTRWTRKNPPNYVERSFALLGRTVDAGRVWDVMAAARFLHQTHPVPIYVAGQGNQAVLAVYAALLEPNITGVIAVTPPASHEEPGAPQILNVLRVLDIPEALGLVAPKPLLLEGGPPRLTSRVRDLYQAANAEELLIVQ